ncbi:MAG: hypothetical protein H8E49_06515, partial [Gammaproteobacteria bacterium]|nr:hypothetical protein [Gammaproteobacteria bacterium]
MSDNFTQNRQIMSEALDLKNRLSPAQISRWQEEGYVFVNGLIDPLAIDAMSDAARKHYPKSGSDEATAITDFGSTGAMNFPSQIQALNQITLHESLLRAVSDLLG